MEDQEPQLEVEIATEAFPSLDNVTVVCSKNPGHKGFIPYDRFEMDYIPLAYRSEKLYQYLKNMGDSVVKLTVTCEDGLMRYGTGIIMKYRGKLYLYTNNHVVETDYQAKHCTIEFNYNSPSSPNLQYSYGTALVYTFDEMDKSMLTFDPIPEGFQHDYMPDSGRCRAVVKAMVDDREVECRGLACIYKEKHCIALKNTSDVVTWTHDLVKSAKIYFREFDSGDKTFASCSGIFSSDANHVFLEFETVPEMIAQELAKEEHFWTSREDSATLPIVIGHPHGGPKMVTVGKEIQVEHKDNMGVVLHHSAATCSGSSGAAVIAIGGENNVRGLYHYSFLHCQGCKSSKYFSQTGSYNLNTSSLSIWL